MLRTCTEEVLQVGDLLAALRECSQTRDISRGIQLHSTAIQTGAISNTYVFTTLINMYSKCGDMIRARAVFHTLHHHDVVAWTCLIRGYVDNGLNEQALLLFDHMKLARNGCLPNARTYSAALTACLGLAGKPGHLGRERWLEKGREIHSRAAESGCCNSFVRSVLVELYSRYGLTVHAQAVFDTMAKPDVVVWNALLHGYVENGQHEVAVDVFREVLNRGDCSPSSRTYTAALSACASLRWLDKGKAVHWRALRDGCGSDVFLSSVLMCLYSRCGLVAHAQELFDGMAHPDVIAWTTLLQGYADNEQGEAALKLFALMEETASCPPNARTYTALLSACVSLVGENDDDSLSWLAKAETIHSRAAQCRSLDIFVENKLIDLYARCSAMHKARQLFDEMWERDVVSWTSLVIGYVDNREAEAALDVFSNMSDVQPNSATFVAAVMACGSLLDVERGKRVQGEIYRRGVEGEVVVANSLIELYGRYGRMAEAWVVFEGLGERDVVSWSSLMAGYGFEGDPRRVMELFRGMEEEGVCQNQVTITHLLSACSHGGVVELGWRVFERMVSEYGVEPSVIHYNFLVQLLSSTSDNVEGLRVVLNRLCCQADHVTWTSILNSCWRTNNTKLLKHFFKL